MGVDGLNNIVTKGPKEMPRTYQRVVIDGSNLMFAKLAASVKAMKDVWTIVEWDSIDMNIFVQTKFIIENTTKSIVDFLQMCFREYRCDIIYFVMDPKSTPEYKINGDMMFINDVIEVESTKNNIHDDDESNDDKHEDDNINDQIKDENTNDEIKNNSSNDKHEIDNTSSELLKFNPYIYSIMNPEEIAENVTVDFNIKQEEQIKRKQSRNKDSVIENRLKRINNMNIDDEYKSILEFIYKESYYYCENSHMLKLATPVMLNVEKIMGDKVLFVDAIDEADLVIKNIVKRNIFPAITHNSKVIHKGISQNAIVEKTIDEIEQNVNDLSIYPNNLANTTIIDNKNNDVKDDKTIDDKIKDVDQIDENIDENQINDKNNDKIKDENIDDKTTDDKSINDTNTIDNKNNDQIKDENIDDNTIDNKTFDDKNNNQINSKIKDDKTIDKSFDDKSHDKSTNNKTFKQPTFKVDRTIIPKVLTKLNYTPSNDYTLVISADTDYYILFADSPNVHVRNLYDNTSIYSPYRCWKRFLGDAYSYDVVIRLSAIFGNDYTAHESLMYANSHPEDAKCLFNIGDKYKYENLLKNGRKKIFKVLSAYSTQDHKPKSLIGGSKYTSVTDIDDIIYNYDIGYFRKYYLSTIIYTNWREYNNCTVRGTVVIDKAIYCAIRHRLNIICNNFPAIYTWNDITSISTNIEEFIDNLDEKIYRTQDDMINEYDKIILPSRVVDLCSDFL